MVLKCLGDNDAIKTSSKESVEHAELVIKALGIRSKKIEITPMVEAYFNLEQDMDSLRKGNKMARERMSILFDHSAKERALVLGTSNKTEIIWDIVLNLEIQLQL